MSENAKELVRWAREYETIYILRPTVNADEAARVADRVAEAIRGLNGKITQVDNWGSRKLAYKIAKFSRGIYVYVKYVAFSKTVAEVERNLRLLEPVLRFQTVVLNERVDMDSVEVDEEQTKFLPIEESEFEPEPDLASQLGLAERPRQAPADDGQGRGEDDQAADEDKTEKAADEGDAKSEPAKASEGDANENAEPETKES